MTYILGPVLIIYSLDSKHSKSEIVQVSNLCFLFGKIIQICFFTLNDEFTLNELSTSTVIRIVSSIGSYVRIVLKKKINEKVYQKIIKALLITFCSGIDNTSFSIINSSRKWKKILNIIA